MMPAKSTSDHRTYSSMMYGLAGIASRTVEPEREARGGQIPTRVERTPRPLIRIHHPPIGVEDDHAFAECFHDGLPERGEAQRRWETGVLFSRRHTSLHSRFGGSRFQTAQPLARPAERPEVTVRNASLSDAGPACHPAPGAAVPPGIVRSTGGAGRPTSPTAPLRACPGAP